MTLDDLLEGMVLAAFGGKGAGFGAMLTRWEEAINAVLRAGRTPADGLGH